MTMICVKCFFCVICFLYDVCVLLYVYDLQDLHDLYELQDVDDFHDLYDMYVLSDRYDLYDLHDLYDFVDLFDRFDLNDVDDLEVLHDLHDLCDLYVRHVRLVRFVRFRVVNGVGSGTSMGIGGAEGDCGSCGRVCVRLTATPRSRVMMLIHCFVSQDICHQQWCTSVVFFVVLMRPVYSCRSVRVLSNVGYKLSQRPLRTNSVSSGPRKNIQNPSLSLERECSFVVGSRLSSSFIPAPSFSPGGEEDHSNRPRLPKDAEKSTAATWRSVFHGGPLPEALLASAGQGRDAGRGATESQGAHQPHLAKNCESQKLLSEIGVLSQRAAPA